MKSNHPIPVFAVPTIVRPNDHMVIALYWDDDKIGINWDRGTPVTRSQLRQAIIQSGGQYLPNDLLPALDPGDVVQLAEGIFWIDKNWELQAFTALVV